MSRFNKAGTRAQATGAISTTGRTGRTQEGGDGFERTVKSELFLLGISNFVGQQTFYESADDRDGRFKRLVREVAVSDPEWTYNFLVWLRSEANMRTAALVGAAEFVHARVAAGQTEDGFNRKVVSGVLLRADEPGEFLGYWATTYGKSYPMSVKRGLADAVNRLYNEYSLLKYDTPSKGYRFGKVVQLVHPNTDVAWKNDLYKYAIDRWKGRDTEAPESLAMVRQRQHLYSLPKRDRRELLLDDHDRKLLGEAGMTWEALSGWLQGPMDAAAWEAIIPQMGYMALLRNLRNFDQAGISENAAQYVADKLRNPEEVAKSRQFPFRFLSAYRHATSLRWGWHLEQALNYSLANVPQLKGNTLILVDRSGSMNWAYNQGSDLTFADQASIFGSALAMRAEKATLVQFGTDSARVNLSRGDSLLKVLDRFHGMGGTNTTQAVQRHFNNHNRVVIVTDEQAHFGGYGASTPGQALPQNVPLYTWNLNGYRMGHEASKPGRYTFGGLTDQAFSMIPMLEAGTNETWPWED